MSFLIKIGKMEGKSDSCTLPLEADLEEKLVNELGLKESLTSLAQRLIKQTDPNWKGVRFLRIEFQMVQDSIGLIEPSEKPKPKKTKARKTR